MIADAHLHLRELFDCTDQDLDLISNKDYRGLVSCHSMKDVEFAEGLNKRLFISFGVHPQGPSLEGIKILEKLIKEKRIDAVGEIGFDKYSNEFKEKFDLQVKAFECQLDLAVKNDMTVVLHIRKAFEDIFRYSCELSKLPSVIFHSFSGTYEQAEFFLNRGVNAFFSFGTAILNGHKRTEAVLRKTALERILVETDAPYQPLKGEKFSKASDILKVIEKTALIKGVDVVEMTSITSANLQKTLTKRE